MPIETQCSDCQKRFRVKDELAGKKFKCTSCGSIVTVGNSASKAAPSDSPTPTNKPTRKPSAAAPPASGAPARKKKKAARPPERAASPPAKKKKRPAKKKRRPEPDPYADDYQDYADDSYGGSFDDFGDDYGDPIDDYGDPYDEAPPRRKKKKKKAKSGSKSKASSGGGGMNLGFNINRLNIALIVIGGMLVFFGFNEARLSAQSSSAPTEITLADFLENPPDSIYLTVSGLVPTEDGYVYEETGAGKITKFYQPCHPPGSNNANFILYSSKPNSHAEVDAMLNQPSFTGMITNDIRSLGREEKQLLSTSPGVNVSTATIFEIGRKPAGAILVILYFLGGAALILGGLAWIFLTGRD